MIQDFITSTHAFYYINYKQLHYKVGNIAQMCQHAKNK